MRCEIFKCDIGDVLVLKEWDNFTEEYTGRILEKEIIYILDKSPQEENYNFQTICFK